MGWDCNQRSFRTTLFPTIGTAGTTLFATETAISQSGTTLFATDRTLAPVISGTVAIGSTPAKLVNVRQFCCFIRVVLADLSRYRAKV